MSNLYQNLPPTGSTEAFEILLQQTGLTTERMVSRRHCSPRSGWYDQHTREWVVVLQGRGQVQFEDGEIRDLGPGDYLDIAPLRRHRVSWTAPEQDTNWLAVHLR